jgi:hypothetical protein
MSVIRLMLMGSYNKAFKDKVQLSQSAKTIETPAFNRSNLVVIQDSEKYPM